MDEWDTILTRRAKDVGMTGGGVMVDTLSKAAPMLAIMGAVNSAIGGYYAAKSQKNQLKSQALTMDFQRSMSEINARQSEFQAQSILQSGQQQVGQLTMRYGKLKGARRASVGASGISLGVGSVAEVEASQDLAKEVDAMTINANSVRASEEARMRGVGFQNQGLLQGVSADNLRGSASTISSLGMATTSLMGSASSLATGFYNDSRFKRLMAEEKRQLMAAKE